MDNIKNIINDVIGKIAARETKEHEKIERIFENILEEHEGKHIFLEGMKEGIVLISVDSPVWLYQMRVRKRKILERLKKEIETIKDIRFKLGKKQ